MEKDIYGEHGKFYTPQSFNNICENDCKVMK